MVVPSFPVFKIHVDRDTPLSCIVFGGHQKSFAHMVQLECLIKVSKSTLHVCQCTFMVIW